MKSTTLRLVNPARPVLPASAHQRSSASVSCFASSRTSLCSRSASFASVADMSWAFASFFCSSSCAIVFSTLLISLRISRSLRRAGLARS